MIKYKIIFIVCFFIILGLLIYTFLPQLNVVKNTFDEKFNGDKVVSQDMLRASSKGEAYISDEVREYNKNVIHEDVEGSEYHTGSAEEGGFYKTPIYGGESVARHFENSSNYYKGEIKLEDAFYNYIPELQKNTLNMSNSQLIQYFEANSDIIENKLGVVSSEDFVQFIGSMDKLKGRKYTRIDIPSNAVTENYTNLSINFLVELTLEDGNKIAPVSINISHLKSTVNQEVPYIQFVGLYKSQRLE